MCWQRWSIKAQGFGSINFIDDSKRHQISTLACTPIFVRMVIVVSLSWSPELWSASVQQHRRWPDIHQVILMVFKMRITQLLKSTYWHQNPNCQLQCHSTRVVQCRKQGSMDDLAFFWKWLLCKKQWQIWMKKHPEIHQITLWDFRL